MQLYLRIILSMPFCMFFGGCEKPSTTLTLNESEEKESSPIAPESVTNMPPPTAVRSPEENIVKKVTEIIKETPPPEKTSEPVLPPFSDELLQAVQNWQKIPRSVFPLEAIKLSQRVTLEAKSSSGKVLATSIADAGEEVTALGVDQGGKLVVASPNMLKLRGSVDFDQTDFKQMVAYLFELRKEQRERLKNQPAIEKNEQKITSTPKPAPKEELDQEIPDPLDFGHGRFCICKECRQKRLAKTGSLKTGHGLEP
jgi:hypothetical protein